LVRRDTELYDVGRNQHAAARAISLALAAVEEKTFAHLQRVDVRLQLSDNKLQAMHGRVLRLTEQRGDHKLDQWARSLVPRP
jgi:hypothetical protein